MQDITILISIDGLRADFDSFYGVENMPTLCSLAENGVRARHVIPQFNTITLANHTSIATGLYAENHGFVSNTMLDWRMDDCWWSWGHDSEEVSHLNVEKSKRWWKNGLRVEGAEPIWTANQRQGGVSGAFAWPLMEMPVDGILPKYMSTCNCITADDVSMEERFDTVFDWLTQNDNPANFVALYIGDLDHVMHATGTTSVETQRLARDIDDGILRLKSKLEGAGLWPRVNLIVTADHGQIDTDPEKVVYLDDFIDKSFYIRKDPIFWPLQCSTEFLYEQLSKMPHMNVYTKEDLAKMPNSRYHNHPRIGPIVVIPHETAFLLQNRSGPPEDKGAHVYHFDLPSMWPALVAHGPAFKKALDLPSQAPVDQVDIATMCYHALKINSPPNDGKIDRIKHVFNIS